MERARVGVGGGCWGLGVGDLLSLTHTIYLTGLIFIHSLWRVSSDVSKGEERKRERKSWNEGGENEKRDLEEI